VFIAVLLLGSGLTPATSVFAQSIQLLTPINGDINQPVRSLTFSWTPVAGATKYRLMISLNPEMTKIYRDVEISAAQWGSTYPYPYALDYSTNFFWRVMVTQPWESEWSATFAFQTEPMPPPPSAPPSSPPPAPPTVQLQPAVAQPDVSTGQSNQQSGGSSSAGAPLTLTDLLPWLLLILALGTGLFIFLRYRRRNKARATIAATAVKDQVPIAQVTPAEAAPAREIPAPQANSLPARAGQAARSNYCPECGHPLKEGAKFCAKCGRKLG